MTLAASRNMLNHANRTTIVCSVAALGLLATGSMVIYWKSNNERSRDSLHGGSPSSFQPSTYDGAKWAFAETLSTTLERSPASELLDSFQREQLVDMCAGLLAGWLWESPEKLEEYMVALGGTPRVGDASAELKKRWSQNPNKFPWKEVRAGEAAFALPELIEVDGQLAIKLQGGSGRTTVMFRSVYAMPWESIEPQPVGQRLQVHLHIPVVSPSGDVYELMLPFIWSDELASGWSPLRLHVSGAQAAGVPEVAY